jgi:hypothetical protein
MVLGAAVPAAGFLDSRAAVQFGRFEFGHVYMKPTGSPCETLPPTPETPSHFELLSHLFWTAVGGRTAVFASALYGGSIVPGLVLRKSKVDEK